MRITMTEAGPLLVLLSFFHPQSLTVLRAHPSFSFLWSNDTNSWSSVNHCHENCPLKLGLNGSYWQGKNVRGHKILLLARPIQSNSLCYRNRRKNNVQWDLHIYYYLYIPRSSCSCWCKYGEVTFHGKSSS